MKWLLDLLAAIFKARAPAAPGPVPVPAPAAGQMVPSENCLAIIRRFEGFRAAPYFCPAGVPTIGYGSTRYEDGTKVTMQDAPINRGRADQIMKATLASEYAPAVNRYVTVPLNQNQFDALVDFAYNCGAQNLRNSTLLRKLNNRDYGGAANEFTRWVYADGVILQGLVRRRTDEKILFETAV